MAAAGQGGGEIKALTSLRGVAAMAVVLTHFSATAESHSSGWIPSLVPHGYMAVDFFFVLSGFIMSYTYLDAFRAEGMRAYGPFLWKRVARIFPLGLAVLAVILLCGGVASVWGRADLFINRSASDAGLGLAVLVNALHLQGFVSSVNLNDPSWSVSVELGAYVLFPVLVAVVLGRSRLGLMVKGAWLDFARCCAGFVLGMATFRVFRGGSVLRRVGGDGWTWFVSVACVASLFARVDLVAALLFPAVVLAWSLNTGVPSRIMSSGVPYFLGTISFSIYLVHHMFRRPELELLRAAFPEPVRPGAAIAFALAGSLSTLPAAALAYRWVERPGRTALNALVRQVRSAGGPWRLARGR